MNSVADRNSRDKVFDQIGQFVTVPHSFIHSSAEQKLSYHARWLFVTLRFYTNSISKVAFPSYSTITKLTGMRREKISDSIKELVEAGWLGVKKSGRRNIYLLLIPRPEAEQEEGLSGYEGLKTSRWPDFPNR